jgi:exonuclease SbcD
MKNFSFVHTADLHLDSGFKGIADIDGRIGKMLSDATFTTFSNIITFCINKNVDFLLISGDVYDAEDRSLKSQLRFQAGMRKLEKNNIQVYMTHGNHDPINGWSANLDLPSNVHVFSGKKTERFVYQKQESEVAQINGMSFLKRDIKDNLTVEFPIQANNQKLFTIGLLHCNVGSNTDHEPYSPCSISDLLKHNYHYWALGHIHAMRTLNQDPWIVYPGNPQGLNPKETGTKGFMHVTVNDQNQSECTFIPADTIRWFTKEVSIQSLITDQELIDSIYTLLDQIKDENENKYSICRIILTGRGSLYLNLTKPGFLEELISELRQTEVEGDNFVWIESIVNKTEMSIDRDLLKQQSNFIGDLMQLFDELKSDEIKRSNLLSELDPLFTSPVGRKLDPIQLDDTLDLIKNAENYCLSRLPVGNKQDEERTDNE